MTTPRVAVDRFPNAVPSNSIPCEHFDAVTPSDTDELVTVSRELHFVGAGTVAVVARGSSAPVTLTVAAGQILYGCFRKILATGTTATGIVAAW